MKTKRKPEVGEKLFYVHFDKRYGNTELYMTVTHVGRKYFDMQESWRKLSFHIDTWRVKSNYSQTVKIYETRQEYIDEQEAEKIWGGMKNTIQSWTCPFTLDQLKRIKLIIDEQ